MPRCRRSPDWSCPGVGLCGFFQRRKAKAQAVDTIGTRGALVAVGAAPPLGGSFGAATMRPLGSITRHRVAQSLGSRAAFANNWYKCGIICLIVDCRRQTAQVTAV